jgi:ADP-heptose:LPS heptosyltransferase
LPESRLASQKLLKYIMIPFRPKTELDIREYNFLLDRGGAGDLIARLPAIKFVLENHPYIIVNLWVHQYGVELCKKLLPYSNVRVGSIDDANLHYNDTLLGRSPDRGHISNLAMHITDHAFFTLAHRGATNEEKNYLKLEQVDVSEFNLPEKFVVITTGYTSKTREWPASSINEVVDYIISKGYTPVFLGKSFTPAYKNDGIIGTFEADYSKGLNLIDKTDLIQANSIMSKSACVVGSDNGLLHLAALSEETKIVYAFTSVEPHHRLPYRKNELGYNCFVVMPDRKKLKCFGCQSNMIFAPTTHDFRDCWYGNDDIQCTKSLTSDLFIEQLEKIL